MGEEWLFQVHMEAFLMSHVRCSCIRRFLQALNIMFDVEGAPGQ